MKAKDYLQRQNVSASEADALLGAYQFAITKNMMGAIERFAPSDPIAAQFFPDPRENDILPSELADPIGDAPHSPLSSLVHRYPNRVLWKITPVCAVYCRFCFRKEHIGRKGHALSAAQLRAVGHYLRDHREIEEVIFSGGDPLSLTPHKLAQFSATFADLRHILRLRIHTRIPVVAPEKINAALLQWLASIPQTICVVIHANHPNELTESAANALQALRRAGALLFSQTVLLKGVNDDPETLANLMNAFLAHGVTPYYLHHLDLARGSNHFRIPLARGIEIEKALRARLSGIAMPTYIVEIPAGGGKIPVRQLTDEQKIMLAEMGIE